MRVEILSIADFYNDPDEVRKFALSQEFSESGNYPGKRTTPFLNDWAGVCYLTPDAPLTAGTGIFKHKETGLKNWIYDEHTEEETKNAPHHVDHIDYTKWELVDRIGNVYNRLILYRGDLFHVSLDYFGKDIQYGRLFQTFFFNTEK
jgi:hypothetical protein